MNSSDSSRGPGRWIRPILVVLAALAAGVLLVAPMAAMQPKDLPIAVVNLDEGFQTPQTTVRAGELALDAVTGSTSDGMIAWQILDSQDALDEALENNDIYAALVIPADFSESQVMAQQGLGAASALTLIVNEGKHPMVTGQISGAISGVAGDSGVTIETEAYNEIPDAVGLTASVLPMVFMILIYIASYAGGITIRAAFPLDKAASSGRRAAQAARQLIVAVVAAAIAGITAAWVMSAFAPDLVFSFSGAAIFLAVASFALMTLVIGSINWLGIAGMVVPVAILLLGMGTANLPYEFLPAFWQDWIYPWNPLRFLAEGSRALLFRGAGAWNAGTLGLIATGVVGLIAVGTSMFRKARLPQTSKDRE